MTNRRTGLLSALVATAVLALATSSEVTAQATSGSRTTKSADGVPITYEVRGTGAPTLVFVHGWSCDRTYWQHQLDVFSRDYTVVTVDLAGHGGSGRARSDWSILNFAEDVAAVIRAIDARNVITIGHSLGGPVALEVAVLLPDRVIGVVGVDAFFDGWAGGGLAQLAERMRQNFTAETQAFVRRMFLPTSPSTLVDQVANAMASAPPAIAIPALEGVRTWAVERQAAAASALSVPMALIMAGSPSAPKRFQAAVKSAALVAVEGVAGAGHFVMQEAPDVFNARLREVLTRLRSGR